MRLGDKPFAVFVYEDNAICSDLKILPNWLRENEDCFQAQNILVDLAQSLAKATDRVDYFKAHYYSSGYDLAIINLNDCSDPHALEFMLNPHVLGAPPIVFLASRLGIARWPLNLTRAKRYISNEQKHARSKTSTRAPSCLEIYSAKTRGPVKGTLLHHVQRFHDHNIFDQHHANRYSSDRMTLSLLRTPVNNRVVTLESLDD